MPWSALVSGVLGTAGNIVANEYSADRQREWSSKMQNAQNEYNSPVQQRKRLRQAGVNPGLAMQNGMMTSGQQSTLPSYDRPSYDFSPVVDAVNTGMSNYIDRKRMESETRLTDENTIAQQQRNKYGLVSAYLDVRDKILELERKGADTKFLKSQASYMEKQIHAFDDRNQAEVNKINQEAMVAEKQQHLIDMQASTQRIINEYLPQEKRASLRVSQATVDELLSAAYRNDAEAANAAADKILKEAQKEGVDIDNRTRKAMKDALVDDAFNKADESYWNAQTAKKTYTGGHLGRTFGSNSWDTPASDRSHRGRDPRYPPKGGVR